jgi:hypothetical protein
MAINGSRLDGSSGSGEHLFHLKLLLFRNGKSSAYKKSSYCAKPLLPAVHNFTDGIGF